jgi:hypothetical protein
MRINSTVVAVLVFLLLGPAVAGPADAPKGFRHLTWGTAPGKHLKKIPAPSTGGITLFQPRPGKPLPPLFKVPVAEEAYSFSQGKFFSASAWLDGKENFAKIKAALIKTYGQTSAADERRNFRIWKWPNSAVEVRLIYNEEYSRATVTYIHTRLNISNTTVSSSVAE